MFKNTFPNLNIHAYLSIKNELNIEPIKWANANSALFKLDEELCANPDDMQTDIYDRFEREYLNLNNNQMQ